jgi:hypothetical protein
MVTHDEAWAEGTPCWIDLGVHDIAKAGAFYAGLFGWDVQEGPPEAGGYAMCLKEGRPVAGIGPAQGSSQTPPTWVTYIASNVVDETVNKVKAAGGQILVDPMDVMDMGRMAVASDPAGAIFGIWQSHAHTGIGLANEPGALCWTENLSRDFEAGKDFYRAVFGYEYGDMSDDGFKYATLKLNGREVGGIGEFDSASPAGAPGQWSVYFGVEDTDATTAALTAAGGSVARPPSDTPYGRIAVVTDDQGAAFSLISIAPPAEG